MSAPVPAMTTLLLVLLPGIPLLAGLLCRGLAPRKAGAAHTAAALTLLAALGNAAWWWLQGAQTVRFGESASALLPLALRLDALAAIMSVLVAFVGWVVIRFSRTYLTGDPGYSRFHSALSLTLAAVLTLVVAGSLDVLLGAWIATSLGVHRLLLHYPNRAGAVFSAKKKFVFSRIGDALLLGATVLIYRHYGTMELDTLFAAIAGGDTAPLPTIAYLLVGCAILKSAQFPFHSWLPDTMETPTPVSAFMHAGIINAGGFLILRLTPIFEHAAGALAILAIIGTVTAAFGAIVMLAQPSVKRALAYSTIAQMGFMMLQCGLGAYGLALLHLVAHSLYKARAFLLSGSTVAAAPRAAIPLRTGAITAGVLIAGVLVSALATLLNTVEPGAQSPGVFALLIVVAIAYGFARAWSTGDKAAALRGAIAVGMVAAAGVVLHAGAAHANGLFASAPVSAIAVGFAGTTFVALFIFQVLLWRAGRHEFGRRLHVHALNGFYVGTAANRLLNRLWPRTLPA